MNRYDFSDSSLVLFDQKFIPLGIGSAIARPSNYNEIRDKISRINTAKISEVWGTLGWENGEDFKPTGLLIHSNAGNTDEGAVEDNENEITIEHIKDLKAINPELSNIEKVTERVLNFDELSADLPEVFTLEQIPTFRLDLFVAKNEGAIVYFQHSVLENHNDKEALVEFIQCEATDEDHSPNRDRLKYFFDYIPSHQLEVVDEDDGTFKLSATKNKTSFVVKILTFKRKELKAKEVITEVSERINRNQTPVFEIGTKKVYDKVGKEKYCLMYFDKSENQNFRYKRKNYTLGGSFVPVDSAGEIDGSKKTLFLIHGTFVNTVKSYLDIWKIYPGETKSFLQQLMEGDEYEQIIAFDHPTISQSSETNASYLLDKLNEFNIRFTNQIDIITTSKGALLAEWITTDLRFDNILNARKVLMFSPANGCGYFTTAKYISKGLSIWRKTAAGVTGKIILGFAQLSVDYFRKLPGCRDLTPEKTKGSTLQKYLTGTRNNPVVYKSVICDWNKSLADGFWEKIWKKPVDFVIRAALGREHDWVIGCNAQELLPKTFRPFRAGNLDLRSVHGKYLNPKYVQNSTGSLFPIHDEIKKFFNTPVVLKEPNLIDIHAHVFSLKFLPVAGAVKGIGWAKGKNIPDWICRAVAKFYLGKMEEERASSIPELKNTNVSLEDAEHLINNTVQGNGLVAALNTSDESEIVNYIQNEFAHEKLADAGILNADLTSLGLKQNDSLSSLFSVDKSLPGFSNSLWNTAFIGALKWIFKKLYARYLKPKLDWFMFMTNDYKTITKSLYNEYPEVGLFIHHDMDMNDWYPLEDSTHHYDHQVTLMSDLMEQEEGKLLCFYAYNPNESLVKLEEAVLGLPGADGNRGKSKGYAGVKFYPASGYKAWYEEVDVDFRFQEKNLALFQLCVDHDIPLFTHCNYSGMEAKENFWKFNNPIHWEKALNKFNSLRLCFGHAGGDEAWFGNFKDIRKVDPTVRNFEDSFSGDVFQLAAQYPNVYCDFGYSPDIIKGKASKKKFIKRILKCIRKTQNDDIKFETKFIYGTDWHMLMQEHGYNDYFSEYDMLFKRPELEMHYKNFFKNNALSYLNLEDYIERKAKNFLSQKAKDYLNEIIN